MKDKAHHTPEVIDLVGVEKRHGPAFFLRRESAQEKVSSAARDIGRPRMPFNVWLMIVHVSKNSEKMIIERCFS